MTREEMENRTKVFANRVVRTRWHFARRRFNLRHDII